MAIRVLIGISGAADCNAGGVGGAAAGCHAAFFEDAAWRDRGQSRSHE
jgi:hypothetical protein